MSHATNVGFGVDGVWNPESSCGVSSSAGMLQPTSPLQVLVPQWSLLPAAISLSAGCGHANTTRGVILAMLTGSQPPTRRATQTSVEWSPEGLVRETDDT